MAESIHRVFACSILLTCGNAFAHQPIISDGSAVDAAHAIRIKDVQVSQVVYHKMTAKARQLWITFEVDQPQKLRLQLGVPLIERLREYRPAFVLLGPGLPNVSLPFETPSDSGGLLFDTRDAGPPRVFHEPFTGTDSWILGRHEVQLPAAGRYYVVAYHPSDEPGKLWMALGEQEAFGLKDIIMLPRVITQVRRFHEMANARKRQPDPEEQQVLFDSNALGAESEWVAVNDDLMGGVSEGEVSIGRKGVLTFSGTVSLENNGGFASIRSRAAQYDLSPCDGLLIRVRGDGQRYTCTLRTDFDIMAGSYQCKFNTKKDKWQKIFLSFDDFAPTSFGQRMRDAPPLNKTAIRSFGFMISDKQAGPFKLEVNRVEAIRHPPARSQSTHIPNSP